MCGSLGKREHEKEEVESVDEKEEEEEGKDAMWNLVEPERCKSMAGCSI